MIDYNTLVSHDSDHLLRKCTMCDYMTITGVSYEDDGISFNACSECWNILLARSIKLDGPYIVQENSRNIRVTFREFDSQTLRPRIYSTIGKNEVEARQRLNTLIASTNTISKK